MHISEINIYPIKSLKGVVVQSARVEERGLELDRRWMLTTPDGTFFTQRQFPQMAAISVEIGGGELTVESQRAGSIRVPFEPDRGERQMVTVWQSVCEALVYKGEVSEWFSDAVGTRCQLVMMPRSTRRPINPIFARGEDIVSFADGYPLLAISESSLADLNGRLSEQHDRNREEADIRDFEPLPMNRFRPNLVVGNSRAYAEDDWRLIRVGEAVFRSTKPCARCVITTVDQAKGEFDGKEPLKTLAAYRLAKDVMPGRFAGFGMSANDVLFGQNLVPETDGATVSVGDRVDALETF